MSTVNCHITNAQGDGIAAKISFRPLSNPQVEGTIVILANTIDIWTDPDGTKSVVLEQGNYSVTLGTPDNIVTITVPNDSNTYNLTDLINNPGIWSGPPTTYGLTYFSVVALQCFDDATWHNCRVRLIDGQYVLELAQ